MRSFCTSFPIGYKFPSPDQPTGRWTPAEASDRLLKNYARLGECLDSSPGLRQRLRESRPLKAVSKGAFDSLDGYQWLLAAAAHTERHTKQILEVNELTGRCRAYDDAERSLACAT